MMRTIVAVTMSIVIVFNQLRGMEEDLYEYELLSTTHYNDKLLQVKFINPEYALFLFENRLSLYCIDTSGDAEREVDLIESDFSGEHVYLLVNDYGYVVSKADEVWATSLPEIRTMGQNFESSYPLLFRPQLKRSRLLLNLGEILVSLSIKEADQNENPHYDYISYKCPLKHVEYDNHNDFLISLNQHDGIFYLVLYNDLCPTTFLAEKPSSAIKITNHVIQKFVLDSLSGILILICDSTDESSIGFVTIDLEAKRLMSGNYIDNLQGPVADVAISSHRNKNLLLVQYQDLPKIDLFSCELPRLEGQDAVVYSLKQCLSIEFSSRVISSCFASPTMLSIVTEDGFHYLYRIKKVRTNF